ncbi:hypothetical protein ACWDYH_24400 [Nocardia goodfellowii]
MNTTDNGLPRRVVKVDFGAPKHPTLSYTAPPDVIARFVVALRLWNPGYRIEVEPLEDPDENVPPLPYWRLYAWD